MFSKSRNDTMTKLHSMLRYDEDQIKRYLDQTIDWRSSDSEVDGTHDLIWGTMSVLSVQIDKKIWSL